MASLDIIFSQADFDAGNEKAATLTPEDWTNTCNASWWGVNGYTVRPMRCVAWIRGEDGMPCNGTTCKRHEGPAIACDTCGSKIFYKKSTPEMVAMLACPLCTKSEQDIRLIDGAKKWPTMKTRQTIQLPAVIVLPVIWDAESEEYCNLRSFMEREKEQKQ